MADQHGESAPPSGNHTCGYGPDGQCAACIAAAPPKCSHGVDRGKEPMTEKDA